MKKLGRMVTEVGFIVFLFYSNLLMGEFERSAAGQKRGLLWAITDVVTPANIVIGLIAGVVGYILFESVRKKL